MFQKFRRALKEQISRPRAGSSPDRSRRRRSWAYLRKAIALWLGRDKSTVWLYCDTPDIYAAEPVDVEGPVTFRGWALSMRGISAVSLYCDGVLLGEASYGISRPDVAVLASHVKQSSRCGFHYRLDPRSLSSGLHELTVKAESYDGSAFSSTCKLRVTCRPDDYMAWRRKTSAQAGMLAWMKRHETSLLERPCISLFLQIQIHTDVRAVLATIRSLREQAYSQWQLCISCDKPAYEKMGETLSKSVQADARIAWCVEPFATPSDGFGFPLERAGGDFVGLIDPGDLLAPNALFEIVYQLNRRARIDFLYTDEDTIVAPGVKDTPILKSAGSAHGVHSGKVIGRLWLARRDLLLEAGAPDAGADLANEGDLLRRLIARSRSAFHVPSILCSRPVRPAQPGILAVPDAADHYSRHDKEPIVVTAAPFPMLRLEEIQQILVVMLDHLGDVLLTFPALERLRLMFPCVRITALVGSWAAPLARGNQCIDDVLTYDFFAPSSATPRRDLDALEEQRLEQWLSARGFDLAIDFRREPETREFLRWSRARYTAGFCKGMDAEWLTVGLPYESNLQRVKPRRHVIQELIHLVNMIGLAGQADISPRIEVPPREYAVVDEMLSSLLPRDDRLCVAIHPGSGRSIKCWPAAYFARLADLLIERVNARILLFGSVAEMPLVESIQNQMTRRSDALALAGRLTLSQLLAALQHCQLFIGNDSGPTHMAAGAGVPTLCVCSGTVDPIQWAPAGPAALVVHRVMACAPCYLRDRDECPFDVACMRDLPVESVWEAAVQTLLPHWSRLADTTEFACHRRTQQVPAAVSSILRQSLGAS